MNLNWFKPNDWLPVWSKIGEWTITSREDRFMNRPGTISRCQVEIQYSDSRKKYRIRTDGDDPKLHSIYSEAVAKLAELTSKS